MLEPVSQPVRRGEGVRQRPSTNGRLDVVEGMNAIKQAHDLFPAGTMDRQLLRLDQADSKQEQKKQTHPDWECCSKREVDPFPALLLSRNGEQI